MKDKDGQVDFDRAVEKELRELKVMYEHLEDQIKAKDMMLGRLQDQGTPFLCKFTFSG